jgi:hypothetical protein
LVKAEGVRFKLKHDINSTAGSSKCGVEGPVAGEREGSIVDKDLDGILRETLGGINRRGTTTQEGGGVVSGSS